MGDYTSPLYANCNMAWTIIRGPGVGGYTCKTTAIPCPFPQA